MKRVRTWLLEQVSRHVPSPIVLVPSEPSSKPLCLKAWKDICAPKNEGGLGVRNLQAVNHGLILAAAWRIAERPNSQLYRVLQSKYFYDTSIWRPKSNLPKSAFWTAVLKILPLLQQNSFYQIMAGNTSIWSTPWCQAWTSVFDDLIIQQEPFSYPARVNQLWIQGQRIWDTTLVDSLFAPPTAHIIRNTPIISSDENDILVWKPSPNGKCSSKSAYRVCLQALQGKGIPAPAPVDTLTLQALNQVWKNKLIIPRVKTFAWHLLRRALPSGATASRFSKHIDAICARCGLPENDMHLFFNCPYARAAWFQAPWYLCPDIIVQNCPSLTHAIKT